MTDKRSRRAQSAQARRQAVLDANASLPPSKLDFPTPPAVVVSQKQKDAAAAAAGNQPIAVSETSTRAKDLVDAQRRSNQ